MLVSAAVIDARARVRELGWKACRTKKKASSNRTPSEEETRVVAISLRGYANNRKLAHIVHKLGEEAVSALSCGVVVWRGSVRVECG